MYLEQKVLNQMKQAESNETVEKLSIMANFVIPLHISLPLYEQFAISLHLKNPKNHLKNFLSTRAGKRRQRNVLLF